MSRACSTNGEKKNAYRIVVAKPERKRSLGRPRRRWVDSIKMDLREIGCDGVHWIDLAQDRDNWRALVSTVMSLRVPQNDGKFLEAAELAGSQEGLRSMSEHFLRYCLNEVPWKQTITKLRNI
jgi:hypothetical protein